MTCLACSADGVFAYWAKGEADGCFPRFGIRLLEKKQSPGIAVCVARPAPKSAIFHRLFRPLSPSECLLAQVAQFPHAPVLRLMADRSTNVPLPQPGVPAPLGVEVFHLLFERSSDAILLLDSKAFTFVDCNDAAVRLLGAASKRDVLDTHPWQISPERQPCGRPSNEKANEYIEIVVREGTHRFEWMHLRKDGSEIPVEVVLTSVQLGDRPLIVTIWREIAERKAMEKALRESENKFRLLFERSADPMQLLDLATWRFIDCNAALVSLMHCASKDQIVGLSPWDISPEFQPDGARSEDKARSLQSELMTRGSARFEWTHRRADGSTFPTEVTLTVIEEPSDRPLLFVIWREISERKRAENAIRELNASLERRVAERAAELVATQEKLRLSEERFRLSFEHAADPIILMDVDTSRFVEANDAAVRFWGADDVSQLLRTHPWEISPERQPDGSLSVDLARQHIACAKERGAHRFEWTHSRFTGTQFPAEVSLTVVQFSDKPLMMAVLRDLTERKLAEAEMMKNLAKARELSDMKSSFVSMVSHEFRTPLAVILSSAELLQNHLDRLPAETRTQQLGAIGEATQHMSKLIDEVLLLGKVEAGQMRFAPAPLDLRDFCARLVDEMLSATQHRCPIELIVPSDLATASGDESLLRHVFGNLLSNAVKYSAAGKPVRLEVIRDGDAAVISIIDQGAGIPEVDLPRIFQAFQRAGNVGQVAGTGLGLVIVQRCVDLHGGIISLESEVGRGTRVTTRLPMFGRAKPISRKRK